MMNMDMQFEIQTVWWVTVLLLLGFHPEW